MLDPRMVPWPAMILAFSGALPLVVLAFLFWKRPVIALPLVILAPVAGWLAGIWKLQGWPKLPPLDIPLWGFWLSAGLAVVAGVWTIASSRLPEKSLSFRVIAVVCGVSSVHAWIFVGDIFKPFVTDSNFWFISRLVFLYLTVKVVTKEFKTKFPTAQFLPHLITLLGTAMCLALTGTASVSLLCMALLFASLPGFLLVMAKEIKGTPENKMTGLAALAPLITGWGIMLLSGPALASTPLRSATILLLTPLVAGAGVSLLAYYFKRRNLAALSLKHSLIACAIGFVLAAAPVAYVVITAMIEAAKEEPYY